MIFYPKRIFNSKYLQSDYALTQENAEKEAQDEYDKAIKHTNFDFIYCPDCKHLVKTEIKGYYYRYIFFGYQRVRIKILRIKCTECGKTHAVFFLDFVPWYGLISYQCQSLIKNNYDDEYIQEDVLQRLRKRCEKFKKLIICLKLQLTDLIGCITSQGIKKINKSYLQTHKGMSIFEDGLPIT